MSIGSSWCSANSCANSLFNALSALSADFAGTQKLILYSEEDWVIKITEIPAFDIVENTRDAMPTIPCIPEPETLNMATLSRLVIPFTFKPSVAAFPSIKVPLPSGFPVFLIKQGIFNGTSGPMVRG